MNFITYLYIFILGTIVGSFINAFALRFNTGLSPYNGRSKCFSCNTNLRWYELIPIFSYLFLRGKCRTCKNKISLRYLAIEILTGLVFLAIAMRQVYLWPIYGVFKFGLAYSMAFFVYYAFVFCLLIVVMLYDIKHKIIPNSLVYIFIALSFLKLFIFFCCKSFILTPIDLFDLLTPFALFLSFGFLWLVSRGRWIGFGDAKLVLGVGALVGFVFGIGAIVLAFWIGALWSIALMLYGKFGSGKRVSMKTQIPFAPFIIIATLIVFVTRIDVMGLGNLLEIFR